MQPMPWMASHIDDLTAYLAVAAHPSSVKGTGNKD
jgi:hypothetical protein